MQMCLCVTSVLIVCCLVDTLLHDCMTLYQIGQLLFTVLLIKNIFFEIPYLVLGKG